MILFPALVWFVNIFCHWVLFTKLMTSNVINALMFVILNSPLFSRYHGGSWS